MLYFDIIYLANDLLPSIKAASFVGPNTGKSNSLNLLTTPAINAISGPTMVKSIWFFFAKLANAFTSVSSIGTNVASIIPSFPGAQKISVTFESRANFLTTACSRPPRPITKTFISFSSIPASINV